jgi:hypothetical protein
VGILWLFGVDAGKVGIGIESHFTAVKMVKFQKQLEGQLVPEWRNAYVNYKQLKKVVRQIRQQIVREQQAGNVVHGAQHKPTFSIRTTRSRGGNSLVRDKKL